MLLLIGLRCSIYITNEVFCIRVVRPNIYILYLGSHYSLRIFPVSIVITTSNNKVNIYHLGSKSGGLIVLLVSFEAEANFIFCDEAEVCRIVHDLLSHNLLDATQGDDAQNIPLYLNKPYLFLVF